MAQAKKKRLSKKAVPRQITELENAIAEVRSTRRISPRTARLIASGLPRMAQKVAEEATEVASRRYAADEPRSFMRAST
jgi:phosphoribosyl-ATP pyrophosphohydrolase